MTQAIVPGSKEEDGHSPVKNENSTASQAASQDIFGSQLSQDSSQEEEDEDTVEEVEEVQASDEEDEGEEQEGDENNNNASQSMSIVRRTINISSSGY